MAQMVSSDTKCNPLHVAQPKVCNSIPLLVVLLEVLHLSILSNVTSELFNLNHLSLLTCVPFIYRLPATWTEAIMPDNAHVMSSCMMYVSRLGHKYETWLCCFRGWLASK